MANEQALARSNLNVMAQFLGWAGFGYRTITMGPFASLVQAFAVSWPSFNASGNRRQLGLRIILASSWLSDRAWGIFADPG
jgi:hypothetical protein